jgi:hypothetical protein
MTTIESPVRKRISLPRDLGRDEVVARAALEQFGVCFDDLSEHRGLYVYVILPEGWEEIYARDGHFLVDDQGRHRVAISQKTTIYDRYATASVLRRITVTTDLNYEQHHVGTRIIVTNGEETLHTSKPIRFNTQSEHSNDGHISYGDARQEAFDAMYAWCDEHYPEWRNPAAYWD